MTTTEKGQIAAELFADEETGMVWQPVESSQIAEIGYDASTNTLGIKFPAGKRSSASEYHYANVTPEMHQEFMAAESIGSFFGKNIKSRPDLYPFVKVETENPPLPPSSPNGEGSRSAKNSTSSAQPEILPETPVSEPSTALAVIDKLDNAALFAPGGVTDAQLIAGREWYFANAPRGIETEEKRTALKRFARPLQKLRTGIEARAKEFTGETKRQLGAIDTEKRRLVQIVGGIEADVLWPLTQWEQEEEARKIRLAAIQNELAAKGQRVYMDMAEIETAIVELEAFDVASMQEYKIGAESSIAASLKVLRPELERRKEMEALAAELAKLRAEAAERAKQDRLTTLAKIAQQQAEQETAARVAAIAAAVETKEREALAREEAADRRVKEMEAERIEALAQAERGREAAIEAERKRTAAAAAAEYAAMEARAADEEHRNAIAIEIIHALTQECMIDIPAAETVLDAVVKGLIPHVRIEY